jgi:hypothetical protein
MEWTEMTAREKIQLSYEFAFFPPRLNQFCGELRKGIGDISTGFLEALDDALLLHQALPSRGYGSQRALERLAIYQARSRAYAMPDFIQAVRQKMGRPPLTAKEVPGRLVRDIALPVFGQNHTHPIVECRTTTP